MPARSGANRPIDEPMASQDCTIEQWPSRCEQQLKKQLHLSISSETPFLSEAISLLNTNTFHHPLKTRREHCAITARSLLERKLPAREELLLRAHIDSMKAARSPGALVTGHTYSGTNHICISHLFANGPRSFEAKRSTACVVCGHGAIEAVTTGDGTRSQKTRFPLPVADGATECELSFALRSDTNERTITGRHETHKMCLKTEERGRDTSTHTHTHIERFGANQKRREKPQETIVTERCSNR